MPCPGEFPEKLPRQHVPIPVEVSPAQLLRQVFKLPEVFRVGGDESRVIVYPCGYEGIVRRPLPPPVRPVYEQPLYPAVDVYKRQILDIPMDYSRYGTLEGFIRANAEVRNVAFAQNVVVTVAVEDTNLLKFMKEVTERSDGRCTPVTIGTGYMTKEEI